MRCDGITPFVREVRIARVTLPSSKILQFTAPCSGRLPGSTLRFEVFVPWRARETTFREAACLRRASASGRKHPCAVMIAVPAGPPRAPPGHLPVHSRRPTPDRYRSATPRRNGLATCGACPPLRPSTAHVLTRSCGDKDTA